MKLHKNTYVYSVSAQRGFALLMTLIVVSVVISIGLSVLDLSIKQVRLSTNAKDSEIAFHSANAGMECARYWRQKESVKMEAGTDISPECFSVTLGAVTGVPVTTGTTGTGAAYVYNYDFTWGTPQLRCTRVTTFVAVADVLGSGFSVSGMPGLISGYPDGSTKACAAGERCTVVSVRGYNKACTAITEYGTVEREVLLQF
jgi:Tfp pilus assembly protein PilX